jgi:hypothetical protein
MEKVQGHREVLWPAGTLSVSSGNFSDSSIVFPIAPVDFQSIGGGEGGGFGTFLSEFFFFREFWGRGGGRVTPKPKARVARFLLGMFRNRFFEAGVDAKVSPEVAKVSPRGGGGTKKCHLPS